MSFDRETLSPETLSQMTASPAPRPSRRFARIAIVAAAAAVAGAAGVYGIGALTRNGDPACRPATDLARRVAPLIHGEIAAVKAADRPLKLPELKFRDAEGRERSLADWRGRTVLVNLWATWCVPCRKEMPALDALEAKLGGADFEVVAINIDTRDADKPKQWLTETGITKLAYYADRSAAVFQELKAVGRAFGMPSTVLVDPQGCEIASLAGPAEWASPDALAFLQAALKK
jgi:thiol-disulfide isomerase/thioredoxin